MSQLNDDLLNGEITETPDGSQPETTTTGDESLVNQEGAENLSPEEASWNQLKGSTQERIKSILKERNAEAAKAARYETLLQTQQPNQPSYQQPANQNAAQDPQVATAVQNLRKVGIATAEDVEQKINQSLSGLVYNMEMDRLGNKFNGDNGLPKFDKSEYEDYIQRHPTYRNYSPEDVYTKMYEEEIFDWRVQNRSGSSTTTQTSPSLRPTRTQVREEPLTRELIEQRLQQPDGRQWYERNQDKINAVIAKETPTD